MYKQLITADTLSCCPLQVYPHPESEISPEADWYVKEVVYHLPATEKGLKKITGMWHVTLHVTVTMLLSVVLFETLSLTIHWPCVMGLHLCNTCWVNVSPWGVPAYCLVCPFNIINILRPVIIQSIYKVYGLY